MAPNLSGGGSVPASVGNGKTLAAAISLADVQWCLFNPDSGPDGIHGTYANGASGVGATVTANSNGILAIDGGSPIVGDRVAVIDPYQGGSSGTPPYKDGIYTVTSVGSAGTPWVLTRATDNNTAGLLGRYWSVYVQNGAVMAGGSVVVTALQAVYGPRAFVVGTAWMSFAVRSESGFAWGTGCTATGNMATAVGTQASANGDNAVAFGNTATATGQTSTALGSYSFAKGKSSMTLGGPGTYANRIQSVAIGAGAVSYTDGMIAFSSGYDAVKGDSQYTITGLSNETTNATPIALLGPFNATFKLRDFNNNDAYNKTLIVRARVLARRSDVPGTDSAWSFQGLLRGDGVSSYSWVGGSAPTATLIAQDAAAAGCAVTMAVSGNQLTITVTGQAGKTYWWTATVETDEVAG